jgi:hypothetical protein
MRVRSLSQLSRMVHTSELNGFVLEIQRIGFRSFWIHNDGSDSHSYRSRPSTASRFDDFVYDTGFIRTPAPDEPSARPVGRVGLHWSTLVIFALVLAVAASILAFSNSDFASGTGSFGINSTKHRPSRAVGDHRHRSTSLNARGTGATTSITSNCSTESIATLNSIRSWDDSMNRLPRSWTLLNDVALGGVEQIVARPACELASGQVLVINLLKEQTHWKLKSAAPAGPHF